MRSLVILCVALLASSGALAGDPLAADTQDALDRAGLGADAIASASQMSPSDQTSGALPAPWVAWDPTPLPDLAVLEWQPPATRSPSPAALAALSAYRKSNLAAGDAAAVGVVDDLEKLALESLALRLLPREAGYQRLMDFALRHPTWPSRHWLEHRAEEALFGDPHPQSMIAAHFATAQPETPAGKIALARMLVAEGRRDEAQAIVVALWRRDDINAHLEKTVRAEFGDMLASADHAYRASRLLYKGETSTALRTAAVAGADMLALARAWAAVVEDRPAAALLATVPPGVRRDPGFAFARLKQFVQSEKYEEAAALLAGVTRDAAALIDGDAWWAQRRAVARALLDRGDAAQAYRICADHSAASSGKRVEAEFHAGWIALRFLDDPTLAARHFERAQLAAATPASLTRSAYWAGRAAEASGQMSLARAGYTQAARWPATYFGQLAQEKLGAAAAAVDSGTSEGSAPSSESTRVIGWLYAAGAGPLALNFVLDSARAAGSAAEAPGIMRVLSRAGDAHAALLYGKALMQRGIMVEQAAFPDFGVPEFVALPHSADRATLFAIARQESAFQPNARSDVGAKGLMQMMTATARRTAKVFKVAFDERRLSSDAAFNAQLAAAHLGQLMDEQKGSAILAFAAYNAGGRRVREWIAAYGDPRRADIDPIDWIERIPIAETRDYVQKVVENLHVYRRRLGYPPADSVLMRAVDGLPRVEARL